MWLKMSENFVIFKVGTLRHFATTYHTLKCEQKVVPLNHSLQIIVELILSWFLQVATNL